MTQWTYDDYVLLPEDGRRYEIVNGEYHAARAPNTNHQQVVVSLLCKLGEFVYAHRVGVLLMARCDVVLSEITVVQPDIFFVGTARRHIIKDANIQGAPDLIIEVLNEGDRRYDEVVKRKLYETFGVAEYWIVDPELELVKIHRRTTDAFARVAEIDCETGGAITTPLLPGFSLDVRDVFASE